MHITTDASQRQRIRKLLLAGNPYDAFILEEAGCRPPGRREVPGIPSFDLARTGEEVVSRLREGGFDMLITDFKLPDITGTELASRVRQEMPAFPVVVLTSNTDLGGARGEGGKYLEQNLFIWYGAPSLVRALIELQEDELNATREATHNSLVILLVEDEPNFYSHFVPVLYEKIRQSAIALIPEQRRSSSPWAVIDNRPLVLLRRNFEDACRTLYQYKKRLLALITDLRFPVKGVLDGDAGLRLLYRARSIDGHLPVVVHSRDREQEGAVTEARGKFLWKDSPRLLAELESFLVHSCGFGPFVFRGHGGECYGVAHTIKDLRRLIATVPDVVFEHHALHEDYSTWLAVHGHQKLARRMRAVKIRAPDPKQDVLDLLEEVLSR